MAFESFNDQFYNNDAKLYYSTTEKNDLGAIWAQANLLGPYDGCLEKDR